MNIGRGIPKNSSKLNPLQNSGSRVPDNYGQRFTSSQKGRGLKNKPLTPSVWQSHAPNPSRQRTPLISPQRDLISLTSPSPIPHRKHKFHTNPVPLKPSHEATLVDLRPQSSKRDLRPKSSYGVRSAGKERTYPVESIERPVSRRGKRSSPKEEEFRGGYEGRERPLTSRGRSRPCTSITDEHTDIVCQSVNFSVERPTTSRGRENRQLEINEGPSLEDLPAQSVDFLSLDTGEEFHQGEELINQNTNNNAGDDDDMGSLEDFHLRGSRRDDLVRMSPASLSSSPDPKSQTSPRDSFLFSPGPPAGPRPESSRFRSARRRKLSKNISQDSGFRDVPSPLSRAPSSLSAYSVLPSIGASSADKSSENPDAKFQSLRRSLALPPEPQGNEEKITLGIKLPNGQRIQRGFRPCDRIRDILAFAQMASSLDMSHCFLASSYPVQVYSNLDIGIADSGLVDKTLLHIHEPDD